MATNGERLATLEEQGRTQQREINSLRDTRHEHANKLQDHELRIEAIEKAVEAMDKRVVPQIRSTLEMQAEEIRKIRSKTQKQGIDFGWVMRILMFVLLIIVAIGEGVIVVKLTERPANASPITAPASGPHGN